MLELRGVSKTYGGAQVVAPLDLTIPAGQVAVLLGPSGCGKTTILRMIAGLVEPSTGSIAVEEQQVNPENLPRIRRRIGYVIQEGGLFPHLTAVDNVTLMARHEDWAADRIATRLEELVEMTKIPRSTLARYPLELSGGQRQRLSLMRAVFLQPPLLLLDEPLGALDPLIRAELQRDLRAMFRQTRVTTLLVTHDLVEAARLGDRVCVMRGGQIIQQGEFQEILQSPADDFVREFVGSQVVGP